MSIACHLRRGAVSLTIAALPAIAVASAPSSIADDCLSSPLSFACMGDEFLLEGLGGGNGDPSQVAVAPEPPAAPVTPEEGGVGAPAAPTVYP